MKLDKRERITTQEHLDASVTQKSTTFAYPLFIVRFWMRFYVKILLFRHRWLCWSLLLWKSIWSNFCKPKVVVLYQLNCKTSSCICQDECLFCWLVFTDVCKEVWYSYVFSLNLFLHEMNQAYAWFILNYTATTKLVHFMKRLCAIGPGPAILWCS